MAMQESAYTVLLGILTANVGSEEIYNEAKVMAKSSQIKRMVIVVVHIAFLSFRCVNSPAQKLLSADGNVKIARRQSTIQEKMWEPIFFREIDKRAKLARLKPLRRTILPKDDVELRVWIGFGLIPLEGIIIKKSQGQWSAKHLRSISPRLARSDYSQVLTAPKSGWASFWQQVAEKGVFTLPDSSELTDEVLAFDGESYVVETNREGAYRTYHYNNPALQQWPEARKIIEIVQSILDEFGIQRKLPKGKG